MPKKPKKKKSDNVMTMFAFIAAILGFATSLIGLIEKIIDLFANH